MVGLGLPAAERLSCPRMWWRLEDLWLDPEDVRDKVRGTRNKH